MTNPLSAAKSENLKSSKPEGNNSSGNKSGAAMAENVATTSSHTRRATGPRTPQGKERSKFNARKHGLFSKAVLLQDESRAEYDALLDGLMENLQPQGTLEIVLVENLATLLWRKRRLLQVETAEIEKAHQFVNWDLSLQNRVDELGYANLKDSSDAKLGHSNPLLLIRNAIEILKIHRLLYMAGDSQDEDKMLRTLKLMYGYQDEGPQPYGWRQMSLMLSKLLTSAELAEQGKEDSENPPDVKQIVVGAIRQEIICLAKLYDTAEEVERLRHERNVACARVPSQEVSDRLIRYEAHLSREFDRTLSHLERLQRMRLGQPVLPKLEVHHSMS
jgi:hypothetical protein